MEELRHLFEVSLWGGKHGKSNYQNGHYGDCRATVSTVIHFYGDLMIKLVQRLSAVFMEKTW